MKKFVDAVRSTWGMITLLIAACGIVGTMAIAADKLKEKAGEYERAIVNLERLASQVASQDFLVNWLIVHGEDSVAVAQWTLYPRSVVTDTLGIPLLNVLFLDPNALPEAGILKMYIAPDSILLMRELWRYPKETKK